MELLLNILGVVGVFALCFALARVNYMDEEQGK